MKLLLSILKMDHLPCIFASILLVFTTFVSGGPFIGESKEDKFAKKYLFKFGYYDRYNVHGPLRQESIKIFQAFAGIPVTGKVDQTTIEKMQQPRCPVKDPIDKFVRKYGRQFRLKITWLRLRKRRFVLQGTDWKNTFYSKGKNVLRWTLRNSGRSLSHETVEKVMEKAFNMWGAVTNIDFVKVPKEKFGTPGYTSADVEILVSFESYDHNDGYPFDGKGGVLAHAFYPGSNLGYSGDVHFDNDEDFTYKDPKGTDIEWVAVHEIGHSLGLEHTHVKGAIMYPFYQGYQPNFKLQDDDRIAIQSLYGSRRDPVTTTTLAPTTTTSTRRPAPRGGCPTVNRIEALYYNRRYRRLSAVSSFQNHLLLSDNNAKIFVRRRFTPFKIDAALELQRSRLRGYTAFFSGDRYYIYNQLSRVSGPHSIHSGSYPLYLRFPRSVRKIDAVMRWNAYNRLYFFTGTKYYRYNLWYNKFDRSYPKTIKDVWRGLPDRVDAAFSPNLNDEKTVIVSGNKYHMYAVRKFNVTKSGDVQEFINSYCNQ